jgi:methionyl-tRNA formyltransferase
VLKIHAARPLEAAADAAAAPGTVVAAGAAGIDVACGEGSLWRLLELQPEGKKRMPAAAYLAGNPLRAGERLGD